MSLFTKNKFSVGDRVICTEVIEYDPLGYEFDTLYKTGTIVTIDKSQYGVQFDDYIEGHDLKGKCKNGYGLWCFESQLLKLNEKTKKMLEIINNINKKENDKMEMIKNYDGELLFAKVR